MTLSKALRKYTSKFDLLSKIAELPQEMAISFNVLYLGDVEGDFFPVDIKGAKSTLGWLYGEAHAVIYKRANVILSIDLADLKELSEEKLKSKTWLAKGMMPEENKLQKDDDGKITGFLSVNDVVSISTIL